MATQKLSTVTVIQLIYELVFHSENGSQGKHSLRNLSDFLRKCQSLPSN